MVVASLCLWMRSYFLLCYDFILICFHCNHSKENLPKHIYIYNIVVIAPFCAFSGENVYIWKITYYKWYNICAICCVHFDSNLSTLRCRFFLFFQVY